MVERVAVVIGRMRHRHLERDLPLALVSRLHPTPRRPHYVAQGCVELAQDSGEGTKCVRNVGRLRLDLIRSLALLICSCTTMVYADEAPDQELNDWYLGLKRPGSETICCNGGDCHSLASRLRDGHWQAFVNVPSGPIWYITDGWQYVQGDQPGFAQWQAVPDEVIIKNARNPTDQALGCYFYEHANNTAEITGIHWFCFVPAPEY
jgi:hypothetical protein